MATLQRTVFDTTQYVRISVGTNANRPGSPSAGQMRFNTDTGLVETWNGSAWVNMIEQVLPEMNIVEFIAPGSHVFNVPTGILYSWGIPSANPSTGIQGGSSQQGQAQISQTLTITNNLANTVEYLVSPVASGCTGTSFKVTVPVNPTPTVANQTRTICSGESFTVIPSPVPFGTQYTWNTPVIAPFGTLSGLLCSPRLN